MTGMPYSAEYAALYDVFYRDKPYEAEVSFLVEQLERHGINRGARLLELACGTGEHAIRLAKKGYVVAATDYSAAMVERARQKAESEHVPVSFAQSDMRELGAPATLFDGALCLFDSIGYVQTDDGVGATLNGVRDGLKPGGVFIVEYWHAPAMVRGFERTRVRRFNGSNGLILRLSETELEQERSVAHVTYNVYELRKDFSYHHVQERHTARYFTVSEMEALARRHGFEPLAAYDGFKSEGAVSDDTWHVVAVWRKNAATRH